MVDTSDNPPTLYLMNNACVQEERDTKTAEMTNSVSGMGRGPIPMVRGSDMVTKGKLRV